MATLPTILVNGNGVVGPRNWQSTAQAYTTVDEGISAADGTVIQPDASANNVDTSFTVANTPADFQSMDSLSWQVRYLALSRSDDTLGLQIRVMSGATVLAAADAAGAFQTVSANITNSTMQNSAVTAFAYVNTSASKTLWDAAEVELRSLYAVSMGDDGARVRVDTLELTGTYTATSVAGTHRMFAIF